MNKEHSNKNISSTSLYFGFAAILVLVGIILAAAQTKTVEIVFGRCTMHSQVALTNAEKASGLSGRPTIPEDHIHLFPFHKEQPYFWMKGMLTSIDIIWVADDKIIKIDSNLPLDDGASTYQAPKPVDWVLEVAAGRAAECGVTVGDTITGLQY